MLKNFTERKKRKLKKQNKTPVEAKVLETIVLLNENQKIVKKIIQKVVNMIPIHIGTENIKNKKINIKGIRVAVLLIKKILNNQPE